MTALHPSDAGTDEPIGKFAKQWHYMSSVPIQVTPIFTWPPDSVKIAKWISDSWFPITERAILVGIALLSWFYFQPSMEQTRVLGFGWVTELYLRNLILMTAVAGGLHLYFYTWHRQGQRLQFDDRAFKKRNRAFTFNSQLYDNVFWTLVSGVALWTAYEALMFWLMANGHAPLLVWSKHPVWFVALFFLTPLWISLHFYWAHRWLHWPPLFKLAHALHHRNTNVGPWSGMSMHPIEHLIYLSSVLIHWVVAAHPVHILYHMQFQTLTAATSHAGFEGILVNDKNRLKLGSFQHQMHHRYFVCNYGTLEMPWDRWFGSFHDGTPESHEQIVSRRRRMMGSR